MDHDYRSALLDCHEQIKPYIHRTPVMTSQLLDRECGARLFFKCENFQRMGAFKMRGATHAVLCLSDEDRAKGVVTHSSGNMAQAVSLAAQSVGVPAYIVMPTTAPQVKKDAVASYGGVIFEVEPTIEARQAKANEIAAVHGASFIHPSNQIEVILGQGTAGLEILQDHSDLDVLVAPVGGGGLVAGCGLAVKHFGSGCTMVGAEPMAADDAFRSLASGTIQNNESCATIADGLRTVLGDVNFPIIEQCVDRILRVEEHEIVAAMRLIWERMKIIVEPSSAVPLAAIRKHPSQFADQRIGIILSGGNVDLGRLPFSS